MRKGRNIVLTMTGKNSFIRGSINQRLDKMGSKFGAIIYIEGESSVVWCESKKEAIDIAANAAEDGLTSDVVEAWMRFHPGSIIDDSL